MEKIEAIKKTGKIDLSFLLIFLSIFHARPVDWIQDTPDLPVHTRKFILFAIAYDECICFLESKIIRFM